MESNLTAVQWLEKEIKDLIPNDIGSQLKFKNKVKQAKEMEKNLYICNKCKSQINEKEIMQQVQDSKKSD